MLFAFEGDTVYFSVPLSTRKEVANGGAIAQQTNSPLGDKPDVRGALPGFTEGRKVRFPLRGFVYERWGKSLPLSCTNPPDGVQQLVQWSSSKQDVATEWVSVSLLYVGNTIEGSEFFETLKFCRALRHFGLRQPPPSALKSMLVWPPCCLNHTLAHVSRRGMYVGAPPPSRKPRIKNKNVLAHTFLSDFLVLPLLQVPTTSGQDTHTHASTATLQCTTTPKATRACWSD